MTAMCATEAISESLEDYLEAMFHIIAEKQFARPRDIAGRLHVTGPSVTGALRTLAEKGLVNYAPYDVITFTPEGRRRAAGVVRRHEALRDFFIRVLGIDETEADEVACRMEHTVSTAVHKRFVKFIEFMDKCPLAGTLWAEGFAHYCEDSDAADDCSRCIASCLERVRERKPRHREEEQ
jgi:DtxR family Mn-dependent transcriptional regulator